MIFFPMICSIWKGLIGNEQFEKSGRPESFEFRFSAAYGFRYSVKGSKDLKNWDTLEQGIIGEGGTVTRVYRVEDKIKFFKVSRE